MILNTSDRIDLTWNPHPRDPESGHFIKGGRLEGTYLGGIGPLKGADLS